MCQSIQKKKQTKVHMLGLKLHNMCQNADDTTMCVVF